MSMLAGNSMESENSDGTGDFPTETCRRLRAECQRMMARLIDQHKDSCHEPGANERGHIYEWHISHLPTAVVSRFGDLTVTHGNSVVDLSVWNFEELHCLHQELERGTIRVNQLAEQSAAALRPHELGEGPNCASDRRCTNCRTSKGRSCDGNAPCLECVLNNCDAPCAYLHSVRLSGGEVDGFSTIQQPSIIPNWTGKITVESLLHEDVEKGTVPVSTRAEETQPNLPKVHPSRQTLELPAAQGPLRAQRMRTSTLSVPNLSHEQYLAIESKRARKSRQGQSPKTPGERKITASASADVLNRARNQILRSLKDQLASTLGELCGNLTATQVVNPSLPEESGNCRGAAGVLLRDSRLRLWRWHFHSGCVLSSFPDGPLWQWSMGACYEVLCALDANQISVAAVEPVHREIAGAESYPEAISGLPHSPEELPNTTCVSIRDNTSCGEADPSLTLMCSPNEQLSMPERYDQPLSYSCTQRLPILASKHPEKIPQDTHDSTASQIPDLGQKLRSAELLISSSMNVMLRVSKLDDRFIEADMNISRVKGDLSSARATIRGVRSQIESDPTRADSGARHTSSLQAQLDVVKNENAALRSELENVKNALEEQVDVSANQEERLRISQKECEIQAVIMDKFYAQQKTDQQTIKDLEHSQTELNMNIASEQKTNRKAFEDFKRAEEDLKVRLASLRVASQKTIADLQQAQNDLKIELASKQKTSEKTIRNLQQDLRDLKKQWSAQERKSRKTIKDLEQSHANLKVQLAASKETAAGHQRQMEIQVANAKKAVGIQRELDKQAATAGETGVIAGEKIAHTALEEEQAAAMQAHDKQLEEARYEVIETGRASIPQDRRAGGANPKDPNQARIEALMSLHKAWDGITPNLLPEPGNLSTKVIMLLEILGGETDPLAAYKLLSEALRQRYESKAHPDKGLSVTGENIDVVLARQPVAPAPQNNPTMPRTLSRRNSLARPSAQPTVEVDVDICGNRSRYSSAEMDDETLREHVVAEMLLDFSSQKRPASTRNDSIKRPSNRPKPICLDSDEDRSVVDVPAPLKRPLPSSDAVEPNSKRLKSIPPDSDSDDDDCTIVVDVSRLEDENERRLRQEKLEEHSRRNQKLREQKAKLPSSSVLKSGNKLRKN